MTTYFKSGSVNLKLDTDNSKALIVQYTDTLKIVNVVTGLDSYNRILENSTNTSIWTVSDQTTFDLIISEVVSTF